MRGFLKATVLLIPFIALWAAGLSPLGLVLGLFTALALAAVLKWRHRDATIALVQAGLLGLALAASLAGAASAPLCGAAGSLGLGAYLLSTALRGRPWSAGALASEWQGMTDDPIFLTVNNLLSAIWGVAVMLTGAGLLLLAGPVLVWGPLLASSLLSIFLPAVMIRRLLARRLAPADPNPWASPVLGPPRGDTELDVAVIGAGVGGLTAAALLAKAGMKVAVFERHDKPGGFCHSWQARAEVDGEPRLFRFDGGVHDVSSWHEGGSVRAVLGALGLADAIDWRRLDHRFAYGGDAFQPSRGWDGYTRSLVARFPGHERQLRALLADIRTIYQSMYATAAARGGVPGQPVTADGLITYARAHPLTAQWVNRPFAELLEHHGVPPGARELLWGLSIYLTYRREVLRVGDYVPLFSYFMFGGHYPAGGSGALTRALADSIMAGGGTMRLGQAVSRVVVEQGNVLSGVGLEHGDAVACRAVVLNADLIGSVSRLLPAGAFPPAFAARLAALRPANSGFLVYLGIRGDLPELTPITHLRQDGIEQEVIITTLADRSAAPEGFHTVELLRLVPPDEAEGWLTFSDDHEERKQAEARRMIAAAETLIPGLGSRIVFRSIAAPPAFQRYGGTTGGTIYALDTPFGSVPRRSSLPGLVLAGAMTRGPGVEAAMISGVEAADALLPGVLNRLSQASAQAPGCAPGRPAL